MKDESPFIPFALPPCGRGLRCVPRGFAGNSFPVREEFVSAIRSKQEAFDLRLPGEVVGRLANYYELVLQHNSLLHLVAPCSPEEFAVRHVLESLTLLEYLPRDVRLADVGTGAGLPSVPCLIARSDLAAILIESKEKKVGFLRKVLADCELAARAEIINRQFAEVKRPDVSYVACRALDRFTQNLPRLLKWSGDCTLLFFGGPSLREELAKNGVSFVERLMPMSEQRYLFVSLGR